MDIKDSVVRLYVKQFIIPKALIFDKPGFVDFKISGKTNVFARQLLVPESFFIELEKTIVKKYGDQGRSAIYSTGKKFGYAFSQLGRFENIKDHPGEGIRLWIAIASKFVEGTYASGINQTVDVQNKTVDYILKNFVVCRKLGYDFFFATGGAAGIVAWLLQDKSIEGYFYNSKFEGENHVCQVKCAPFEILKNTKAKNIFSETNLDNLAQDILQYNKLNEEVEVRHTKSFSDYLDAKIFNYQNGIITLCASNERFFLMEVQGLYLLELELKQRKMNEDIFDIASKVGKSIFGNFITNIQYITELTTALGWGEVNIISSINKTTQVIINHFPWTKWYKDIDFLIIRGFLSGLISNVNKRVVVLDKPKIDIHNGHLILMFNEKG